METSLRTRELSFRDVEGSATRNLRKAFQAARVQVGLELKTGPWVWQHKGLPIADFRRSGVRYLIRFGGSPANRE